jgi:hypothetical protein
MRTVLCRDAPKHIVMRKDRRMRSGANPRVLVVDDEAAIRTFGTGEPPAVGPAAVLTIRTRSRPAVYWMKITRTWNVSFWRLFVASSWKSRCWYSAMI